MSFYIGCQRGLGGLVAAVLTASVTPAAAEHLVLESYVGERPDDAEAILTPVFKELAARDHMAGARAVAAVGVRLAGSGAEPTGDELTAVTAQIERAESSYYDGSFEAAAGRAERAWQTLIDWSGYLSRNQEQRALLRRALAVYAGSQRQLGASDKATRAMAELVRAFPDQPLTTAEHSPQLVRAFRKVARDLAKQGQGTLEVVVDDPSVAVFIDEAYTGAGSVTRQLAPGRYRVYAQKSDERPGRVHEVDINAGASERLSINWALDGALRTRGSFAGFAFTDEAERRAHEAKNAVRVARTLAADSVIALGLRTYDEQRALVGVAISLDTGQVQRSAHLTLEPVVPSADRLRELARFLAGDESAGPFEPVVEAPLVTDQIRALPGRPVRWLKWLTAGAAVAALATGGTLIVIHREMPPDRQVPYTRNSRPAGIIAVSAGAVLVGAGVYLFLRDGRDARAQTEARKGARTSLGPSLKPVIGPTRGGFAAGLSGRF